VLEVGQETSPSGSWRTPGRSLTLSYLGTTKDLSTVLHVELSRAPWTAGAPRRIAVLWVDGHLALAGLADQDLNELNADLELPASDPEGWGGWTWIDETEPYAAGHDATNRGDAAGRQHDPVHVALSIPQSVLPASSAAAGIRQGVCRL
jgi:hypothetical protein